MRNETYHKPDWISYLNVKGLSLDAATVYKDHLIAKLIRDDNLGYYEDKVLDKLLRHIEKLKKGGA